MGQDILTDIKLKFKRKWDAYHLQHHALQQKIDQREKQIERLRKKMNILNQYAPKWTEHLVRPMLDHIKVHFPDWTCEDQTLQPMANSQKLVVFFIRRNLPAEADPYSEENCIYLLFHPGNLSEHRILYSTELNAAAKEIISVDEVIEYLKSKIVNREKM